MLFKMALWLCALMFLATLYNAVSAYEAIDDLDIQDRFMQVGLLEGKADYPLPARKPLQVEHLASY